MIHAKFEKAAPTQEGITYTLKGPRDRAALHEAADLIDQDCIIAMQQMDISDTGSDHTDDPILQLDDAIARLQSVVARIRKDRPIHE